MSRPRDPENGFPEISKRGARRVIQRAFVLVGREKAIRQHLREVELVSHWSLEDWGLEWTVVLDHGAVEFHRGRVGRANVKYSWPNAANFFAQVQSGVAPTEGLQFESHPAHARTFEAVFAAFHSALRDVLRDPVDDSGDPLL
jgi:hypothetical protein